MRRPAATSTVRQAATSAWPITWPPNTRCQPICGERPRNRFSSSVPRSRMSSELVDGGGHERLSCQIRVGSAEAGERAILARRIAKARMDRCRTAAQRFDVLIAGGGFAGLALAIALRQALGRVVRGRGRRSGARRAPAMDARASAIAAAARRLFEAIGVWDSGRGEAQPILDMVVTDSKLARRDAADVPDLRRRRRAGRAVRAHDRERRHAGGADRQGEARRRRAACRPAVGRLRDATAQRTSTVDACGWRRRSAARACWSPPTARARASANAPASRLTAGLRPVRHRHHGRA